MTEEEKRRQMVEEGRTFYRIQLASNFQVVEFTLGIDDGYGEQLTIEDERIMNAVNLVNKLGEVVVNTVKSKEPTKVQKVEEMASAGQIKFLKKFGIDGSKMTKKEAWQKLKELTNTETED